MVSAADPYGRILGFLDQNIFLSLSKLGLSEFVVPGDESE
jgi:hypothetical protein